MEPQHQRMGKKQVGFDSIEIIELPMTLGDHPSVSSWPPLTVGWKEQQRTTYSIDFFEKYRPQRRSLSGLVLSAETREGILFGNGFCSTEAPFVSFIGEAGRVRKRKESEQKKAGFHHLTKDQRLRALEARRKRVLKRIEEINQSLFLMARS